MNDGSGDAVAFCPFKFYFLIATIISWLDLFAVYRRPHGMSMLKQWDS